MTLPSDLEAAFWPLFARTLGRDVVPGRYQRADLPEWDSLRHVELIFELEEQFGVSVPSDAIAPLYSDTDAILDFLRERATTAR
jgi:hypothetical protein